MKQFRGMWVPCSVALSRGGSFCSLWAQRGSGMLHNSHPVDLRPTLLFHPEASLQGILWGLGIIGEASQWKEMSCDCQLILLLPTNGCGIKMTSFHTRPQLGTAAVQVKWMYRTDSDNFRNHGSRHKNGPDLMHHSNYCQITAVDIHSNF